MFLFSSIKEFMNDDFPALGLPITANLGKSSFLSPLAIVKDLTSSSNKSPVPLPFMAEILNCLLIPNE